MKLSEVKHKDTVIISNILGHGSFRRRISEMGFVKGKEVQVIKNAPFNGPFEFKILDYNISLRKSEAELIEVVPLLDYEDPDPKEFRGTIDSGIIINGHSKKTRTINIALVGNPNCGKTTLFNYISKSKEKVGNYSGVTVDIKKATFYTKGYQINFFDLPGTYSLTAYSPEEIYVRKFIYEQTPDIIINVIDSTNLERNLFLTTQLLDMDVRIVGALNMFDDLKRKKIKFDYRELSKLLGIPFIPTISSKGIGLDKLIEKVIEVYEGKEKVSRQININYGRDIEDAIHRISNILNDYNPLAGILSSRFVAIKLLEKDPHIHELLWEHERYDELNKITSREIKKIETLKGENSETVITDSKYGFINGALKETFVNPHRKIRTGSERIDDILTNKYLGFPIFVAILFVMFYSTFNLGTYPMEWIDAGIVALGDFISGIMPDGMLKDLLVKGVLNGAGSVLVFLPNILILFFFISLLEESGYMARAAFIMDNIMHRFGLHGRSFIPLIMGFGCNVPAIMATRSMRNRGHRLLTMMIIPFMSCSARLPVYILIISAFFQKYETLILIGIYAIGILFAFVTAQVLNLIVFKKKETPFVMELPSYRMPTFRNIIHQMWDKTRHYLKKIGTVILLGVIIIWALEYFPRTTSRTNEFAAEIEAVENSNELNPGQKLEVVTEIEHEMEADRLINSYIGRIGQWIEPAMRPLGFDWKMSISLVAGLPAKEIVVSTMGVIYQTGDDESTVNLQNRLKNEVHQNGEKIGSKVFTTPAALSFLVFILLYFPCVGVVATIKNESESWYWAGFVVVYTTALAWAMAFVVYNIGNLFV